MKGINGLDIAHQCSSKDGSLKFTLEELEVLEHKVKMNEDEKWHNYKLRCPNCGSVWDYVTNVMFVANKSKEKVKFT